MIRTFLGITLADSVRVELERQIGVLRSLVAGARWVEPSRYHLTLAFLGDVAETDLDGLIAAVGEAVRTPLPFALELKGLGAFPNPRRARVLWAGLSGAALPRLLALRDDVAAACARVGYRADEAFHPHVTLARLRPGRSVDLTVVVDKYRDWSGGAVEVGEVVVFASELKASGPVYQRLGTWRLGSESGGWFQPEEGSDRLP
ncbi:MAG: RNA 2',3'-cyclic phosphodiesterase [Isosphaeraceae bacterium]|jgi:2'-5' RNA ligase|nr:MAG: RNA 2',3'-cyclic phosphodiesterase [Isosphaeraceae bacterium]